MPGAPRKDVVREGEIGVYHTWSRCVQRAFLCGIDPLTGINYDYRRCWTESLIKYQTSVFCVEVGNYTILSNHLHLICRTRPDLVQSLSDQEVAWRWKMAWPQWNGEAWTRDPTDLEIKEILLQPEKLIKIRQALGSLSWFMARVKEPIARLANQESNTSGHFYEARFGARELVDAEGMLMCSSYVDLNQMKAELAAALEKSHYSAIQRRIRAWKKRQLRTSLKKFQALEDSQFYPLDEATLKRLLDDCWLLPIEAGGQVLLVREPPSLRVGQSIVIRSGQQQTPPPLQAEPASPPAAAADAQQQAAQKQNRRARQQKRTAQPTYKIHNRLKRRRRLRPSDHCFLDMPFEQYLEHVRWAADQLRHKRTSRPPPQFLRQRNIDPDRWYQALEQFEQWCGRAVGRPENIEKILQRGGRRWLHGLRRCRATFS